jgi:hypothetical protein
MVRYGSLLADGSSFAATAPLDGLPASFSSSSVPLMSPAATLARVRVGGHGGAYISAVGGTDGEMGHPA